MKERLELEIAHAAVPGRVRLRVVPRGAAAARGAELEAIARCTAGITGARLNRSTGALLVKHARALTPDEVRARLAAALAAGSAPPDETLTAARARGRERRMADGDDVPWHALPIAVVAARLRSSADAGLDASESARRVRDEGGNALPAPPMPSLAARLQRQFANVPSGLLAGSAAASVATGGFADAAAIAAVMGVNAAISLVTEGQADKVIRSLAVGAPATVDVIRVRRRTSVPLDDVACGELLVLEPGSYVAADARLVGAEGLSVDESALTGESYPVAKAADARLASDSPLAERRTMVYRGTRVTGGSGRALVVANGVRTELGRIQSVASGVEVPATPLQRELDELGRRLALVSVGACAAVGIIGLARRMPPLELAKLAISLGVAAVPEGLPTVATSTLALGVRRMAKRHVAVRRLGAIEALGAMDVLCLDKTGTLTENRMRVAAVQTGLDAAQPPPVAGAGLADEVRHLLEAIALCNDADGADGTSSSATERALVVAARAAGIDPVALRRRLPRLTTAYRTESRRYMVTVHRKPGGRRLVVVKGSPAEVLALAARFAAAGGRRLLNPLARQQILDRNDGFAREGRRVLGVAVRVVGPRGTPEARELDWLGLVALADPIRAGVKDFVAQLHAAGIRPVMVTGDQAATAAAVGAELGLAGDEPLRVLEAADLARLEPAVLRGLAERTHVFARVSPSHKLAIVRALQDAGRVVGMTGDGINDGPALRAANVGIAMGGGQQDVARSVSDIVLERDDLPTLLGAIAEGRTIYANVRKSIRYLLSTNFSEIESMLAALLAGAPPPLSPIQLLWINLITDVVPALALALEPEEPDVMRQPPRRRDDRLLGRRDAPRLVRESLLITAGTLASYAYGLVRYGPGPAAQTQAFGTLTFAQLLHAICARSERTGIFDRTQRPRNRKLELALAGSTAVQALAMLLPPTRRLLGTTPIGPIDATVIMATALAPFLANEVLKPLAPPREVPAPRRGRARRSARGGANRGR